MELQNLHNSMETESVIKKLTQNNQNKDTYGYLSSKTDADTERNNTHYRIHKLFGWARNIFQKFSLQYACCHSQALPWADFQQGMNSENTSQRGVWISTSSLKNRKSLVKAISLWHRGSTGKSDRKYPYKKYAHWTEKVSRREVD